MQLDFTDSFLFFNNEQKKITDIISKGTLEQKTVYEVFRIIGGKPLFISDHLTRLKISLNKLGVNYTIQTEKEIAEEVHQLCIANNKQFGNIELRIVISANNIITNYLGFVVHNYPDSLNYIQGIDTSILEAVRENPKVKAKYTNTRKQANAFLAKTKLYDVLLENENGALTEGSRSNLFLIKGNKVYTAPDELVLSGITRLHIINLLKHLNVELVYDAVLVTDINLFDAAFICGTSPGILPIRSINQQSFNVNNTLLRNIMVEYNQLISRYFNNK